MAVERLEDRTLPAVSLTGIPTWVEQGPGPIVNGQAQGLPDNNPVTGAVEAAAVRPGTPTTVLIGSTEGGIWRTNDITASPVSWTPLTDQMPSLAIGSIAFSPFDTNNRTVFAGTGNFSNGINTGGNAIGILKSTDLGNHWRVIPGPTQTSAGLTSVVTIRKLVPAVQTLAGGTRVEVLLVASPSGLFRSTTGGEAISATNNGFTRISGLAGSGLPRGPISDLIADPSTEGEFYCAMPTTVVPATGTTVPGSIFRSTNFGLTWSPVITGITGLANTNNIELAAHFNVSTFTHAIYAGLISPAPVQGVLASVWRTGNDGASWTSIGTAPGVHEGNGQGVTNFSLVADPTDQNAVYVGGDARDAQPHVGNLFIGFANTGTWARVSGDGANGTAPHADTRSMVFSGVTVIAGVVAQTGSDIIETDDGGVYRLAGARGGARRWSSLNGNLRVSQIVSVAYDPVQNRLVAGSQDTGSFNQDAEVTDNQANRFRWDTMLGLQGDGEHVDVDTLHKFLDVGDQEPLRYASTEFLHNFQSVGSIPVPDFVDLNVNGTGRKLTDAGFDPSLTFDNVFQINRVDSHRMMIGTGYFGGLPGNVAGHLYESFDRGDHLVSLGGIQNGAPAGSVGGPINSIVYGGRSGTTIFPDVAYVGVGDVPDPSGGDDLPGFLRTRFSGTAMPGIDHNYPGSGPLDIAIDPQECHTAWVLDSKQHVWQGLRVGQANESWTDMTGNLADRTLVTIALVGSGSSAVPLVGGSSGVFRLDPHSTHFWQEFGAGLPNAEVVDLRWDATDDLLVAATIGRGAWTIPDVSDFIADDPTLLVDGTSGDDFVSISVNPVNPLFFDVNLNGSFQSFQASIIKRIVVNLHDGDDFLQLDGTGGPLDPEGVGGGPVLVPGGLSYSGGNGSDGFLSLGTATLDEYDTEPGSFQMNNRLTYADGHVMSVTINATQQIFDDVVANDMVLTASVTESNITLGDGSSVGDGRLRLDVDDVTAGIGYAPIEFSGKTRLTIHGDEFLEIPFGSHDTITVANTELSDRPLLTGLVVDGGFGDDTINIVRAPVATTVFGGGGADEINFGHGVLVGFFPNITVASSLDAIDARVTVDGGDGNDTMNLRATDPFVFGGLTGAIFNNSVTGFGMTGGGVTYSDVQTLNLTLGPTADSVFVRSTAAGATTNIDTGGGSDFVRLGSLGSTSASGLGNLNGITSVSVAGGDGTDALVLDDSGDTAANTGTLTSAGITSLGMAPGASYSGIESLTLHLGSGADSLVVGSLAATTSAAINANGGADTITLGGSTADRIDGPLVINAGSGSPDTIILQENEAPIITNLGQLGTPANAGPGTGFLSGFGMGAAVNFSNAESVLIVEGASNDFVSLSFASPPSFAFTLSLDGGTDGVIFRGTDKNDHIRVSRRVGPDGPEVVADINGQVIAGGYSGGETVSVFAGDGNDQVEIDPSVTTWRVELYGENGNDHLTGGVLGDLLDGGDGNDDLDGGAGDDELVGGRGRDRLDGGAGADRIRAGDGESDVIFADFADLLLDLDASDVVIRRRP